MGNLIRRKHHNIYMASSPYYTTHLKEKALSWHNKPLICGFRVYLYLVPATLLERNTTTVDIGLQYKWMEVSR